MAILGIERVVVAVRDTIKNNINAALTVVEADHVGSDAIALPRPRTECWYISQKRRINEFPAVLVLGERSRHGSQTGFAEYQTEDEGGGHDVTVTWVDRSDDEEMLRLKLYRSARAITQILASDTMLGGTVIICKVTNEEFFPAIGLASRSVFQQAVRISITCQTEESI